MNYQRFKVKCEYYAYEYTSRVISNLANIVNLYTQIKFQLLDMFPATWSSALKQVAGLESRSVLQNAALPLLETVPRLCNGLPKTPVCHNMYCDNRCIFFPLKLELFPCSVQTIAHLNITSAALREVSALWDFHYAK